MVRSFVDSSSELQQFGQAMPESKADYHMDRIRNREAGSADGGGYHLWPFYAARYYGCSGAKATLLQIRIVLTARQMLCEIQKLLFGNVQATLDFLRNSFGVRCDGKTDAFLVGENSP